MHQAESILDRALTRLTERNEGEVGLTAVAISMGVWLLLPFDRISVDYVAIAEVMPTKAWAVISLALGCSFIAARRLHLFRLFQAASFLSILWWSFLAFAIAQLDPRFILLPVLPSIALMASVNFVKYYGRKEFGP